jgi:hypothetical protein
MKYSAKCLSTYGVQELMTIDENSWYAVGKDKFP